MHFKTAAIHAGYDKTSHFGAVIPPIFHSSTYAFEDIGQPGQFDYSRSGNPTRKALENCLAALEGGTHGFAFATGMAAETTALLLFEPGDRILVQNDLYGGTYRLFESIFRKQNICAEYCDLGDLEATEQAFQKPVAAVWIETPSNPLMKLVDLRAVAVLARRYGAITICDNTFLSPYFQRPLDLGIDIALHSTTKYINGHSDVVGGALVTKSEALADKLGFLQNALGTCAGPHDCSLVLRGVKTLPVRMEEHNRNALILARWLAAHPHVAEVLHPGLECHPQHAIAKRQMSGFGGTFSFRLVPSEAVLHRLLRGVRLFTLAESLGGVESLIDHPATMTHASIPDEKRQLMGIDHYIIRVSVGLEDVNDLQSDLEQALR